MTPTRGFSLLELIIVLVLMGVMVGLVAPSVMRNAGAGRERRALQELSSTLAISRLDAIRAGQPQAIELRQPEDAFVVVTRDQERIFTDWPLMLTEGGSITFEFDARGRTRLESLLFRSTASPSRMWEIVFDPVGGVPTARRHTEASTS